MAALSLWPLLITPLVTTDPACPPADAVHARVRTILGLDSVVALAESAEVGRDGTSLRVTLRAADGRTLGDRLVPAEGTCDELAGVAAVILASWLSDVHPEFVSTLPEPLQAPEREGLPTASAPSPPQDQAPSRSDHSDHRARAQRHFSFGVAVGSSFSSASPAPLAALGVHWLPNKSGLGWSLAATATGAHDRTLGEGNVRYWRWPLSTGPVLRLALSPLNLDLGAGAALTWLHVRGESFALPETHNSLLGGVYTSLRVSNFTRFGPFAPFVEVTGIGWPSVRPYLSPTDRAVTLPHFELFLSLGGALAAR